LTSFVNIGVSLLNMAESSAQFELCENSKKSPKTTWTERETTDLMEMQKGRPCLWNIYERSTGEGVSRNFEGLDISLADIKANITSLRAQLGRERAKTRHTKPGQGLNDSYKSSRIFCDRL